MSEVAVLEAPPEVKPDTETVQPGDTEGKGAAAPEATDADEGQGAQAEETTDPIAKALAAGDEADRAAAIETEVQRRLQEAKGETVKQAVRAKHQDALAKANELVEALGVAPEVAQPLFDLANAAHMEASEQARKDFEAAFHDLVPEARREDFEKETAGKVLSALEFLDAVTETRALESKAVKEMSLEDYLKRSSRGRADLRKVHPDNDEDDPRFKAGFKKGLTAPAGDVGGGDSGSANPRGWTYQQYLNASPSERAAIPADVEAQLIKQEMARRGGKR